jgi:hypothetical protein
MMFTTIEVWTTLALLNANLLVQASRAALGLDGASMVGPSHAEPPRHPDLIALGLDRMPSSKNDLRRAYRLAARTAHPDAQGGSREAFLAVVGAFERLSAGSAGRWPGRARRR